MNSSAAKDTTELPAGAADKAWRAYQQTLPEMIALPEEDVQRVNLNVGQSVTTALGCIEAVEALKPDIALLPFTSLEQVTSLERYALALAQAHALVTVAARSPRPAKGLYKAARETRDLLRQDLKTLAKHRVLVAPLPAPPKRPRGYHGVAFEVLALVAFLRAEWTNVEGKTLLTEAELTQAEALCHQLLTSIADSPQNTGKQELKRQKDLRDRAFTLLVRAYEETRRAVAYLLWEEDQGNAVMPSLYAVRFRAAAARRTSAKRRSPGEEKAEEER